MKDSPRDTEQRGLWGRWLRATLGPIYYWCDWYDATRRPAFNKVKPGLAFFVCTALNIAVAVHLLSHVGDATEFEWGVLFAFTGLNVFASYGLAGLKLWSETKGAGSIAAPGRLSSDAILTRRAIVGGDHEITPALLLVMLSHVLALIAQALPYGA